jgi:23S rRNA pseudouridine1911/1915/1917 synthase
MSDFSQLHRSSSPSESENDEHDLHDEDLGDLGDDDSDDDRTVDLPFSPEGPFEFTAPKSFALQRLDKVLADMVPHISRSRLQALATQGQVTINGKPITIASTKVHPHQRVVLTLPPDESVTLLAEEGPIHELYEDKDLLVLDKPAGLVVHPGAGRTSGTLLNRLLARKDFPASVGGQLRPGIVHRLDMDTTGAMVVAKTDRAYAGLRAQLDDRSMSRRYLALVWRPFREAFGTIDAPLGRSTQNRLKMAVRTGGSARHAITHFRVLQPFGPISLVECLLETGRTHQIRVHLSHIGHPVVGDTLYGGGLDRMADLLPQTWKGVRMAMLQSHRQMLHAWSLSFVHPGTGDPLQVEAPLPPDFQKLLDELRTAVA